MAERAEPLPFSVSPVIRWLLFPAAWTVIGGTATAIVMRAVAAVSQPVPGTMSAEWLREHARETPRDRWD